MSDFKRCNHCNKKEKNIWVTDKKGTEHLICSYEDCPSNQPPKPTTPVCCIIFRDPRGTSRFEDFSYRAGYFMDKAQRERQAAEEASHMGSTKQIYNDIDDISSGDYFGEVE